MTAYAWTLEEVLTATGGTLIAGPLQATFAGIGIDSRTIGADHLFVAIVGESHDGHRFVADVPARGVKGVVVAEDRVAGLPVEQLAADGVACVAVTDTTRALGALGRFNRRRGRLTVLAVTGSNGKTTTRRLMTQVIGQQFKMLGTTGNLNNHIGLPLTLFRLSPDYQTAVLELGMNHTGEINYLGGICEPDVGVITNVGPAHLEGLGSLENVARAKGELLDTIRPGGTAILNADDPLVAAMGEGLDLTRIYFGTHQRAQVRAEKIRLSEAGTAFTLITPSGHVAVALSTPAQVMVSNALAAAAAGEVMGIPLESIRAGLEAFVPQAGRMGIRDLGRDIRLVDDAYNANPASMTAAIDTLARMCGRGRTIAVLGDMLELGQQAETLHRQIGCTVGDKCIDRLYVTGDFADAVADGARSSGMADANIVSGSKAVITDRLKEQLEAGDLILVKGSRGMAMETVIEAICRWVAAE
jgi:UDP-N-acetylmuramoyl-tripeptide--D-alanyl-D-alanine ligase